MLQNEYLLQVLMWAWSIIGCGMFALVVLSACEHAAQIATLTLCLLEKLKLCVGVAAVVMQLAFARLLHKHM